MNPADNAKAFATLRALLKDCQEIKKAVEEIGDPNRYPTPYVEFLREAAAQAESLKIRILACLLEFGPDAAAWLEFMDRVSFTENYRIDPDFRWLAVRPSALGLETAADLIETLIARFSTVTENVPDKKSHRGPKADMKRHQEIGTIVRAHGSDWKTEDNLRLICTSLDKAGVPGPKGRGRFGRVKPWTTVLEDEPSNVIKAIDYSLKMLNRQGLQ